MGIRRKRIKNTAIYLCKLSMVIFVESVLSEHVPTHRYCKYCCMAE